MLLDRGQPPFPLSPILSAQQRGDAIHCFWIDRDWQPLIP
jgi:hypothetical protein